MKVIRMGMGVGVLLVLGAAWARGQGAEPATPAGSPLAAAMAAVPRLVKFAGVLKDSSGEPMHGTLSVTFALYESEDDAVPLWQEMQELQVDEQGHYSVLLGATQSGGLPLEAFAGEQARWLGVQAAGQAEGPRVLLVSVPYALRAEEAEQLGGKPASDYVLASDLLDTLGRQMQSGAQPAAPAIPPAGGQAGGRPVANSSSKNQCRVWNGTKLALNRCGTQSSTGSGWPSSWTFNTATNAVTAQPLANQDAVVLTIAPNVASPSADLFDVFKDPGLTKKVFSVNASGFVSFGGNTLTLGRENQGMQSQLSLYGGTANSKLAPPFLAFFKTDASVKSFVAASTTTNGEICVSATAPTGDCPTSGTIIQTAAFVLPGGVSWTSGAGAPSGSPSGGCTTGSLYSRTDGSAGSTLYVCEGGAWAAK